MVNVLCNGHFSWAEKHTLRVPPHEYKKYLRDYKTGAN